MTYRHSDSRTALRVTLMAALMTLMAASAWGADALRLTIAGPDGERAYALSDLRALGETEITTATPWTDGVVRFTGVTLARLLGDDVPPGSTLRLIALNDYASEMPAADVDANAPVIAYWMNGRPMSIRDKGPFWVIFPFDQGEQFQSEMVFSRSVWQLVRIEIGP
ncbi:MAG: oxidoreductase [Alkalilacustris sp.]